MATSQKGVVAPTRCEADPTGHLVEMFVDIVQRGRIDRGQRPAERPVFRKVHGIAHGRLEMLADRPRDLRVGVFAHDSLPAWVRFSSDVGPADSDFGSTIGLAIKVFGVPGPKAIGEDGETADFIFQNHKVFFLDDARAMCEFTHAGVVLNDYDGYLAKHPKTAAILRDMAHGEDSLLTAAYWALLPFQVGEGVTAKYRLDPEIPSEEMFNRSAGYLATDLEHRLLREDYRFRFMVQRRTNPQSMPLDAATVEWPETESAYVQVATLVLPRQDVTARGQAEYGQALDFNIFRTPLEQAPAPESTLAAARKLVYAASADVRHRANGEPPRESVEPRAPDPSPPLPDDSIVSAVIYPAIGVARVGNSPDDYFIGPEVPDPEPLPVGCYRDKNGALKRQAARFRIFGLNARGDVVRELTGKGNDAQVTWQVELANTKGAWYGFQLALDIPEASAAPLTMLRNAAISDRTQLSIKPGPRQVDGPGAKPQIFDSGAFMGRKVYLGEIHTDDASRLVVLGGHGLAASYDGSYALTFANNEGWFDDTSDGPVTAKVRLQGRDLPVTPAWIIVAPPNYGPQRKSVRTMWDLIRDVAVKAKTLTAPQRPSFRDDILPIFQRMAGLQWVNAGFATAFGWDGAFDLTSTSALARLSDAGAKNKQLRQTISNAFRRFDVDSWSPKPWPWLYGDAMNVPAATTPRQNASLSDLQLSMLNQWAQGDFDADYDANFEPVRDIDLAPVAMRGDLLTRAALEHCLADAFHPGCEITWPMRSASLYMAPFRIAHVTSGWIEPSFGEPLTYEAATIPNGPLHAQMPGGLTRWMAVPWQTDTASCRGGYDRAYDPYAPTFWPARVPNEVLTKESYDIVMDSSRSIDERKAAFAKRASWFAPLGRTSYTDQINNMIVGFDHLGVVETRQGPTDTVEFPETIEVEDRRKPIPDVVPKRSSARSGRGAARGGAIPGGVELDLGGIEKVHRFPAGLPPQVR